ncbi:S-layer homology domain-containing protein [uncultured Oscillibacter sp.]|uniref:S-layer homology domain-containing protein n=1 Tax=uncultured Oscillibacter sp. TaxID=876091 RepID=UPI0025E3F66B|nr:S-layer homology domain-containing protein [uncultured Oscillibacter sp.]
MKLNGIRKGRWGTRLLSAVLCLTMALSLLPGLAVPASAASWMEPYLEKLVSWGVMRGDSSGNLHPDRTLTRAEFVVLVNRAFGYDDVSATVPFRDVKAADWYYDDINIGYTTGYFNGTSKNTASPKSSVTREQAAVLLGRNLVLDDEPGASIDFTDSGKLSNYSRGLIRSAVTEGILSGYGDGSFRPKQSITRGQMAVLLVNAIGTPVNKSGTHTLGGVYGNVTISTSGVTLKDTTIAGNLYITGGLGLGNVTLENVTVLGKIVVCGAGESEKGNNSVILRGVTAPTLVMDNLANNIVSIRAEGSTKIDQTLIRTPSYVEDSTENSYGFTAIRVEGEAGTALTAAGNLKEIVTITPESTVTVAKGSVLSLTVDERAAGSSVAVLNGAVAKVLNLDTGTTLTGRGDVEQLNVNADGTKADMLPDIINIRPGVNADIHGQKMDTTLAAESSADPRLLAGYPKMTDVASVSAKGLMRTNKSGTIYWAVTSVTDGSVGEADLLKPTNNARILKSGNIKAEKSNTDYTASLTGLTSDGSYYFSAMLVDQREQRSPVKAVSFATSDASVPAFATGYPYMSKITNISGEVTVMTTKSCRLYYALMPKNATAPTAADFKSGSLSGNLGSGSWNMVKNVTDTFLVNRQGTLKELTDYDLFLWLTDADGAKSSAVKKVSFTTLDGTPPTFVSGPTVTSIKETSVGMSAVVDEAATIFWVAVKQGDEYPKPMNGQTTKPTLSSPEAKLQVSSGINGLKSGKVSATANKEALISITGLTSESAYDVYYVAQDKAGNYSDPVGKLTVHTLDTNPPSITQEFTRTNDTAGTSPLADTDIRIVFSENVQDSGTNHQLLALYQKSKDTSTTQAERDAASEVLTGLLRNDVQLWSADVAPAEQVVERTANSGTSADWTIDYRYVEITAEDGKTVVTFKSGQALKLKSGAKYYFKIQNIADTSTAKNIIKPNPITLSAFTTVFAQIQFSSTDVSAVVGNETVDFDMSFRALPLSTGNAGDGVYWDLLFRMNIPAKFDLYEKVNTIASDGSVVEGAWKKHANSAEINSTDGTMYGASYTRYFRDGNTSSSTNAELLRDVTTTRYYGIRFTSIKNVDVRETWSGKVEMQVQAVAGSDKSALHNLAVGGMQDEDLTQAVKDGLVKVGSPSDYTMKHIFSDTMIPEFVTGYPKIDALDVSGSIGIQLTRTTGKIFYVIAPVSTITTTLSKELDGSASLTSANWDKLPKSTTIDTSLLVFSSVPTSGNIMTPPYNDTSIMKGSVSYYGSNVTIPLRGLSPKTQYVAYFVLQGSASTIYSEKPFLFGFETSETSRPIIELTISNPNVSIKTDTTSDVNYLLAVNGSEPGNLIRPMADYVLSSRLTEFNDAYAGKGTGTGKVYTVLDAMSNSFFKNNELAGSVFDEYATQTAKDDFAEFIRSQTTTSGDVTMSGDAASIRNKTVDCSPGMVGTTWYTFLTVAKSSAGSGDAFRAIRPVFNTDATPPMVTDCLSDIQPNAAGTAYTGTVTLVFNEDLYWVVKDPGTSNQTVTPLEATVSMSSSGFYSAGLAFNKSAAFSLTPGTAGQKISSVTFSFTNAQNGAYIYAAKDLGDKGGNVHAIPLTVKLDTSGASPRFVVTQDWDMTT